jgi:zinc protease
MKNQVSKLSIKILFVLTIIGLIGLSTESFAQKKKKKKAKVSETKKSIPAPVKGPSVEGITEYTLGNGMKVLLFPDNSQQTITVNITYMVGSRHEGYGETGMAHLLEHMVFKGSTKHPNIPQELTEHGCRPNGTTWLDRTNYYETFTASDDNLKWALDMESDRMVNSFIKKEDLATEFSVVRNEFEMGENDPGSVLMERIIASAYLWHNYGNSTIGSREDIERVPINKLQDFYKKYYQPDNAVLLVAGKIDPDKTLKLVNEYFGAIEKPSRVIDPTYTVEPVQDGERMVELKRVGDVQYIGAMYHLPSSTHPDFPALDLLIDIITNEPSGVLYKNMVETKLATSQYGFGFDLKDPGLAYFAAEVLKDKSLEDAKKAFLKTLDSVAVYKFTKVELDRAKTKAEKQYEALSRNTERLGMTLSEYVAKGDWRLIFLYRDAIEKISLDDIQRVAKYYFKPSNRTYGLFIPETNPDRVKIPETPEVSSLVEGYKGRAVVAQGEIFDPSPENIESRTERGTAPNGLEYAFLNKSTKGGAVSANITLRIGDEKSLSNLGATDNITASMLMKGTKTLGRQALKDSLDKLKANVFVYGAGNTVSANISTTKENLNQTMLLVADILKNPAFDANELEKLLDEEKAQVDAQLSDPMALAGISFQRMMNPYPKTDVRYVPTLEEQSAMLKEVKLDNLKKFHSDFYGTASATISVVGDFEKDKIKSIINTQFANWSSKIPFKRIVSQYQANPNKSEAIKTPDKPNALFLAGINLPMKDTDPDYAAMVMGNYILGGGFLNSRLAVRIRQKEGISYGVGSNFSASPMDESGNFTTYAIYAPENAAKLEQAFLEEINRVRNEGFTDEELKAAKDGWLQSRNVSRAKDNELSGKLNSYLYYDRTMLFDKAFEESVKSLTVEQINNAFRKYIEPSKLSMIKAGDFDKKVEDKKENAPAKAGGSGNN